MQPNLTSKQERLLRYFEREIARTGNAPSLRRAATHLGVSHAAVSQMLKALEKKEVLRREDRYSRTVYLLNQARETAGVMRWREVPVVGEIAAGLPLYAQQEWGGMLVVDAEIYGGRTLFALRVKGDSMKDAAILHGDLAICEPRQFAQNGEIVVVLIRQEEATVKRFFLRQEKVELRPENPAYEPVTYRFDEVLIQGKVIGIQRGPEVLSQL